MLFLGQIFEGYVKALLFLPVLHANEMFHSPKMGSASLRQLSRPVSNGPATACEAALAFQAASRPSM